LVRIGREFVRVNGCDDNAKRLFELAVANVRANSPQLSTPGPTAYDTHHPLRQKQIDNAWRYAVENPKSYALLSTLGMPQAVRDVYEALAMFCEQHGLSPRDFHIDYRRLGRLIGKSASQARRDLLKAQQAGLVHILDPGKPRTRGERPQMTRIALIVQGV